MVIDYENFAGAQLLPVTLFANDLGTPHMNRRLTTPDHVRSPSVHLG
jgi:hypothetical protein